MAIPMLILVHRKVTHIWLGFRPCLHMHTMIVPRESTLLMRHVYCSMKKVKLPGQKCLHIAWLAKEEPSLPICTQRILKIVHSPIDMHVWVFPWRILKKQGFWSHRKNPKQTLIKSLNAHTPQWFHSRNMQWCRELNMWKGHARCKSEGQTEGCVQVS